MENADLEYPNMLKFVLYWEEGYNNSKNDDGGETNKGITHTIYDSYRRSKGLPKQTLLKYLMIKYLYEKIFTFFNCYISKNFKSNAFALPILSNLLRIY